MKTCFKCKVEQSVSNFYRNQKNPDGLHSWCNDCSSEANKGYKLKARYGITLDDKNKMISDRGGHCDICRTRNPNSWGWCVDHDHETGLIRGILCHTCNQMVGHIENGWNVYIPAAIQYLEAHRALRN